MPTGWCCRPVIPQPPTSPARKRCRVSRAPSSLRGAGVSGVSLVGRFGGRHPAHYRDVRHHEGRSEARPRGGPTQRDATYNPARMVAQGPVPRAIPCASSPVVRSPLT
jgi:hypothetical protein